MTDEKWLELIALCDNGDFTGVDKALDEIDQETIKFYFPVIHNLYRAFEAHL